MKYIKRIDENFTVTETELNEAKKFYLIGNKEVSRDEVLSYKYSNPEKPVADRGWPKWLYTNNGPKGKTLEWSSIKKDMKDLEKKYGEGNVVVGGSTNAGGPYIEIYSKSQNESAVNEAKFDKKKLMKAVKGDDGIISTGDGKEYVIYKYGNGNDDNDAMWNDKSIFALDQDGEEHEIEYSDIVRYDESIKPSWDNLLEEFEMVEITNEDLRTEIKKFIKKNNEELDEFADNDNWDAMYQKLYDEFGVEADSAKGKDLLKTFQFIY